MSRLWRAVTAACRSRSDGRSQYSPSVCVTVMHEAYCCFPVRLVGGTSSREGRLEVFYGGQWGTVCDDGFTDASARVVCNMFGYG